MDANIESLIHALCMAAWDAGAESGTVWFPDADMSKRGVVPMTQDEGFAHAREHFARHGGGSESSAFDQALAALRSELARIKAAPVSEEEIKELAEEFGIWPDDVRKIASRLSSIKPVEVDALNTNEKETT